MGIVRTEAARVEEIQRPRNGYVKVGAKLGHSRKRFLVARRRPPGTSASRRQPVTRGIPTFCSPTAQFANSVDAFFQRLRGGSEKASASHHSLLDSIATGAVEAATSINRTGLEE